MTFTHHLLLVLLALVLGMLKYLWVRSFFTPAKTLYERELVEQDKGMGTDVLHAGAMKEAALYFGLVSIGSPAQTCSISPIT